MLTPGRGRTIEEAEPARPQADLRGGLLAGRVEDPDVGVGAAHEAGGGLEQERRLADAGLTAQEDERPGHEPAAEDPVQFADPDGQPRDVRVADLGEGRAGGRTAGETDGRRCGRHGTVHG